MKIGDRVRFLSESGGGIVAGFQGKNVVLVEDEDGFQIPTLMNEVVVVESDDYNKNQAPKTNITTVSMGFMDDEEHEDDPAELPVSFRPLVLERKGGDRLSVYLAFVPTDLRALSQTTFEAYIVNDSNYFVRYVYLTVEGTSYSLRATGEVEPNTKLFIEEFDRAKLNEMERVVVQLLAYKRDKGFLLKPPTDVQLRIDGTKFYKLHTFQDNDFFEEPALIYPVIENDRPARQIWRELSEK